MTEYIPSESVVRDYYVDAASNFDGLRDAAFDRFLARVRRDAKAEAWDEAHEIGWNNADEYWRCDGLIPSYWKADTYPNPYRETGGSDEH